VTEALLAVLVPLAEIAGLGFIVFLRIGAAVALLPGFGGFELPQRVRLGVALAFTAVVLPMVADDLPRGAYSGGPPWRLFATEAVAGLALGLVLRLIVVVLQFAASIAAQATSLAQIFGGAVAEPLPAIGNLLLIGGIALAMGTGLHVAVAGSLAQSYAVLPVGVFPLAGDLADWGVARSAEALGLGFSLAAPFLIVSVIYNVALGIINRAMPQLMVALVGAPAIAWGGLVLLALTTPALLALWLDWALALIEAPFAAPPGSLR